MAPNSFAALNLAGSDDETGETFVTLAEGARAGRRPGAQKSRGTARAGGGDSDSDSAGPSSGDSSASDKQGGGTARGENGGGSPQPSAARVRARRPRPFGHGSMLWLDLEMTGLDAHADHILELACVLSDAALGRLVDGPELVVAQPEEVLSGMNDWCTRQHAASGLVERVRASTLSLREAELQVLTFVRTHAAPGVLNLAGNAVYKDKEFLEKHMPELMAALSWRVIDVSTLNELAHRWYPNALRKMPRKKGGHRAMADVRESIEELKFYRRALFKPPPQPQSSRNR